MTILSAKDITGIVGIVPTPATPNAGSWSAEDTINLTETEKMTQIVIDGGIDIIMTTGTFGECASLTEPELESFVDCVVQTASEKSLVFAGITTLNTRDTIRRARRLLATGADGLFIGRPMWLALDDAGILKFYKDLVEALGNVPLVVYDNPQAFKGKISSTVYAELAKIPQIIASKHVGGPQLEQDLLTVGENIRLLPLESHWYKLAKKHPQLAKASWSGAVACAPAPLARLAQAIREQDWDLAEVLTEEINHAAIAMFPQGSLDKFMDYSIQIGKQRFVGAGLIDPGPARPPYSEAPQSYLEGGLECGRRWAQLQTKYTAR
ncbi:MAG: aldolase [Gammaproteobacteria bacterium]|nr:MAG: aldolase [Gammaproteobacteria bacterium]